MPERIWSFTCCNTRSTGTCCPSCGSTGDFAGWGLTVEEALEKFQRTYGLTPVGPHVRWATWNLSAMRAQCDRCHGAGVEGDVYDWRECPACEGGGGVWSGPEEAIREAYLNLLEEFPDAAAPGALSAWHLLPGNTAMNVSTGVPPMSSDSVIGSASMNKCSKTRRLAELRRKREEGRRRPRGYSVHGLRRVTLSVLCSDGAACGELRAGGKSGVCARLAGALPPGHRRGSSPDSGRHAMDTGGPGVLNRKWQHLVGSCASAGGRR
jgi:hypothetical protein